MFHLNFEKALYSETRTICFGVGPDQICKY